MGVEESRLANMKISNEKSRGGFGKVWKVQYKKTKDKFALKEMAKVKIIDRKSEKSIKGEREFLSQLHHPFIVNMICSFQDTDSLYLVMDLLTGGDLRYHICRKRVFTEEQTKFFLACLIVALEYIHCNNVIHRDIKPENLVCDENGYLALTDFGVAKRHQRDNSSETSGTPGYMAPEVLCAMNHSYPVDYFALGVMGYEFMLGVRPYVGRNRKEIKELVLSKKVQIKNKEIPVGWSFEAADFINSLLQRKPSQRLGSNGIDEIKNHLWFNRFNWDELMSKKMKSPFQPKYGDNFDKKYCEGKEKIDTETQDRYSSYKKKEKYATLFANYTFICYETIPVEQSTNNSSNTNSNNSNAYNNNIGNFSKEISQYQQPFQRPISQQHSQAEYKALQLQNKMKKSPSLQFHKSQYQLQQQKEQSSKPNYIAHNKMSSLDTGKNNNSNGVLEMWNPKPLPCLHSNASMKYLNLQGSALPFYSYNGIYNKKLSTNRSRKTNSVSSTKYGTTTSSSSYNPFMKKSSSMASINYAHNS